jgi:hypothetical protein
MSGMMQKQAESTPRSIVVESRSQSIHTIVKMDYLKVETLLQWICLGVAIIKTRWCYITSSENTYHGHVILQREVGASITHGYDFCFVKALDRKDCGLASDCRWG